MAAWTIPTLGGSIASTGNVYAQTRYAGTATFGGGAITAATSDLVVASFSATGAHRWSRALAVSGATAIDGCGALYTATFVEPPPPSGSSVASHFEVARYQP